MIGTNHEAKLYWQVAHHVDALEKLRQAHNVSGMDFENMVINMMCERRKALAQDQVNLFSSYSKIEKIGD